MKWINVDGLYTAEISAQLDAHVWEWADGDWTVSIVANEVGLAVWESHKHADMASAKAAVCHWIGKTMAQFSNALAAGCEQPDDGE